MENLMEHFDPLTNMGYRIQTDDNKVVEIQTTHTNHLNDLIIIYVVVPNSDNKPYLITDDGYTLSEFDLMGIKVSDHDKYLQSVEDEFSVTIRVEGIELYTQNDNLLESIKQVIKAIQKIDNLLQM